MTIKILWLHFSFLVLIAMFQVPCWLNKLLFDKKKPNLLLQFLFDKEEPRGIYQEFSYQKREAGAIVLGNFLVPIGIILVFCFLGVCFSGEKDTFFKYMYFMNIIFSIGLIIHLVIYGFWIYCTKNDIDSWEELFPKKEALEGETDDSKGSKRKFINIVRK